MRENYPKGYILRRWTKSSHTLVAARRNAKPLVPVLRRIYQLASATGKLTCLVIFGSYVTTKSHPNDVDVILVMADDFRLHTCDADTRLLFDHRDAEEEFGASIFWIRPSLLVLETLETFIAHWQTTREGTRRGIVEVRL